MNLKTNVLFSGEEIRQRVTELSKEIMASYPDDGKPIVFVCVLRGAIIFFSDILKCINDERVIIDFVTLSSYENAVYSSGRVKLIQDLRTDVKGKHVLVVEDIVDSGHTLEYLRKYFESKDALDIKVAVLLDKPAGRRIPITPDFIAFTLERPAFIIGYGLDLDQKYRNIDSVLEILG